MRGKTFESNGEHGINVDDGTDENPDRYKFCRPERM